MIVESSLVAFKKIFILYLKRLYSNKTIHQCK